MQVNTLKEELRTAQARASNAEEALSQVGNHDLSNHDSGQSCFLQSRFWANHFVLAIMDTYAEY